LNVDTLTLKGGHKKKIAANKTKVEKYNRLIVTKLTLKMPKADVCALTQSVLSSFPSVPEYFEMTRIIEEGVWKSGTTAERSRMRPALRSATSRRIWRA
jgi:hypothetical protein